MRLIHPAQHQQAKLPLATIHFKPAVRHPHKGFTLIEMMIVVALIAILAAIALPAYNGYVNRSKIKTAQADLIALTLNVENQYRRQLAYSPGEIEDTGALSTAFPGWRPASSDFSFSKLEGSTSTYTLVATGLAGGVKDCTISITEAGVREIATCSFSATGDWL